MAGYFPQQPFSLGEAVQKSGAQHFQMRGLGVDTTLVLINGRRGAPKRNERLTERLRSEHNSADCGGPHQESSNSASAIYGADAIGGVANIILKKAVESPEIYVHYGAAAGGADEQRIAGSIGSSGSV